MRPSSSATQASSSRSSSRRTRPTAKGNVIDQKPAGGTPAPKGSTVTIYVSSGLKQVNVPNLIGLTQAEAVAKIQALGLLESVQTITDADPSHTGFVQHQDPGAHTKVNEGATVTIWVATL